MIASPGQAVPTTSRRLGLWQAALFYAALTLLFSYPLWVHPASTVLWMGSDTELFAWTLAWDTRAFTHAPFSIFDANIFYPEPNTLAYSENLIGSAIFAAPVLWLTNNPVLAINLVALLSCALCGVGTYLLGRRLGLGWIGAGLAGIVFAFAPPRFFRLGQLHLTTVQWVPFGLASFHAYLDGGRRRDLRLAAGFFTLQALSSGHGTVFLLGSLVALFAWRVLLGEPLAVVRRLRDLGVSGALLLAPAVLILVPYRRVQIEMGLRRTLEDWAISGASFFASPSHVDQWFLSLVPQFHVMERAEGLLFPGILPIILALVALFWWGRAGGVGSAAQDNVQGEVRGKVRGGRLRGGRAWRWAAFLFEALAVVAAALVLFVAVAGPLKVRAGGTLLLSVRSAWRPLMVAAAALAARLALRRRIPLAVAARLEGSRRAICAWRARHRHDAVLFYALLVLVTLLMALPPPAGIWPLVYWLPGLNFIRVPARFTILTVLGLAVLTGFGFERLGGRMGARGRLAAGLVLGVLLVGEFAAMPLNPSPFRVELPAIDRWLDGQPKPFAVAEVPTVNPRNIGPSERRQANFMLHSMAHWQKTVHGFSGMRPGLHDELFAQLVTFPDERSLATLAHLGVNYVVVHTDLYPPGQWRNVEERLTEFAARLKLEHVEGAGRVYSLR